MTHLIFEANEWWLVIILGIVLSLSIELPYRFARRLAVELTRNMDAYNVGQGALLTLAAFVLGLSFAQASARFESRRVLMVQEANAIGTTWLRADQLAPAESRSFRRVLEDYTAARLRAYQMPPNASGYRRMIGRGNQDQNAMWAIASRALQAHTTNFGLSLLIQSLNDTFDVSAQQLQAFTTHIPTAVAVLTLLLVILGTLSIGVRFAVDGSRPAILSAIYVVACVIVVTMMVDYDRPQGGFVTVNLDPLAAQLQLMEAPR